MLEFLLICCCIIWIFSQLGSDTQKSIKDKANDIKESLKK